MATSMPPTETNSNVTKIHPGKSAFLEGKIVSALMAASSPAQITKVGESLITNAAINGNLKSITFETPKQNLRGLNKPKCNKCGNVARSRCPFQSCKSCCAKAQNPCPIHVLKQHGTLPDKPPTSTIPSFEPQSTDAPSSGASWRLTSLRQLSTAVANNLRERKALTRKEAININKWRFLALKEHINGDIEAENEAFERYLQNVRLLEEVFSTCEDENMENLATAMKSKLNPNPKGPDPMKKKMRSILHEKLKKVQETQDSVPVDEDESDAYRDLKRPKKLDRDRVEKALETDNLIDKLSKARNRDELLSCSEMKFQLFGHSEGEGCAGRSGVEDAFDGEVDLSLDPPKLCTVVCIDPIVLSEIDGRISSETQLIEL